MKKSLRRLLTLTMAAFSAMTMMTFQAFADEPYHTYNYDAWGDTVPSQSAYRVKETFSGKEIGLAKLSDSSDPLYVSDNASDVLSNSKDLFLDDERKEFWIADTGNHRILRLDENLQIIGRYYGVTGDTKIAVDKDTGLSKFNTPQGVYVHTSSITGDLYAYIADAENQRVVKAKVKSPTELELVQEYVKPKSALYESKTFKPSKIVVDNAENVYAVVKSVNTGSVQFSKDGSFTGFYGANRVEATAAVIAQKLWRKIASNEQIEGMTRNVPSEYANFDIDNDGFIYTVTETSTNTDAVKKLNPAGYNIWDNDVGNEYVFGDVTNDNQNLQSNIWFKPKLTDIVVSNNRNINVLDYTTGRIFQYDKLCNLICIFGNKNTANQKGSFVAPNAVESFDNNVYVLDGSKNDITVFTETTFGQILHHAYELYDEGKYAESEKVWREVINRDGGYTTAYVGLGKAALNHNQYKKALKYFKIAYDQYDYDKAFEYTREEFLRENFTLLICITIGVIVLLVVIVKLVKKKLKAKPKKAKEGK